MSNCKKSSSLNKKSCHRKKPRAPFNYTWSASTYKSQLLLQEQSIFNLDTTSNYIVSTLPIETRIDFYEKKYQLIMESETQLASWIKEAKEKDPPPLPPKPSTPIPTATRSRLPNFLFASLSTRPKRKSQMQLDSIAPSSPTAKSSISTFLRRASDTLTTSYSKQPSSKKSTSSTSPQNQYSHRFSLTSSLNRLSLSRNSCSSMILSEETSIPPTITNNEIKSSTTTKSKYKRFSTPLSTHIQTIPPPLQQQRQLQQPQLQPQPQLKKTLKSSADSAIIKQRPQSSIIPQSSSSIFLERLRSRSPISDKTARSCQQQPNILSQSSTTHYNSNSSIGTMDEDTPPSSPSSTDSISTPPHTPNTNNNNGHHLLYYQQQQRNRRKSQELFFVSAISAAIAAKPKPSLALMSHITENRILEQQEDMSSVTAVYIHSSNNECNPASTPTAIDAPLNGGNYSVITAKSLEKQQVKKKRASLSVTPSLSTIRLLSQKSQFLRRQSMLA